MQRAEALKHRPNCEMTFAGVFRPAYFSIPIEGKILLNIILGTRLARVNGSKKLCLLFKRETLDRRLTQVNRLVQPAREQRGQDL